MIIREAILDDAAQLAILLGQMGAVYKRSIQDIHERITSFNRERHQLLVAEMDSKVVGLIAFGCYEQFRLQGCCCHIDTLVIDEFYRGHGVGKALLLRAEHFAQERGATEIELTTANHRKASGTHDFYKALGYIDHIEEDCAYFLKKTAR